jgi:VWFA-related protein
MLRFSRPLIVGAIVVSAYAVFHWYDAFHLGVGLLGIATCAALLWLVRSRATARSRSPRRLVRGKHDLMVIAREPLADPLHETLAGLALGAATIVVLLGTFYVAENIPGLYAAFADRDRTRIELQLDALEQAQSWQAATQMISQRLTAPLSPAWAGELRLRLYEDLVAAGKAAPAAEAKEYFSEALALAKENAFSSDLAESQLRQLELRAALTDQTQTETQIREASQKLTAKQTELNQLQKNFAVAQSETGQLRSELRQVQTQSVENDSRSLKARIDMLLGWGDSIETDFAERKRKYLTALALAQEHGLDTTKPASRLSDLEQMIRSREPAALPAGTRIEIARVSAAVYPPVVLLDLRVVAPSGDAIAGLATKDFQVMDGREFQPVLAANQVSPQATPIRLVLLFDCSISTAGLAHQEAKGGVSALVTGLRETAVVKLIAFNSTVTPVTEWTTNPADVAAGLQTLVANGNTALRNALSQAANEFAGRDGPKAVVLYTDGKDTVGGPDPQELIARYKQAGIAIHVVALQTNDLDRGLLTTLASDTGGMLLTASQSSELTTRFRELARSLSCPFYRLVFIPKNPRERLQVQVGGQNAVRVDCALTSLLRGSSSSLSPPDKKETSR